MRRCPCCGDYVDPRDEGICAECGWYVYGTCWWCQGPRNEENEEGLCGLCLPAPTSKEMRRR